MTKDQMQEWATWAIELRPDQPMQDLSIGTASTLVALNALGLTVQSCLETMEPDEIDQHIEAEWIDTMPDFEYPSSKADMSKVARYLALNEYIVWRDGYE